MSLIGLSPASIEVVKLALTRYLEEAKVVIKWTEEDDELAPYRGRIEERMALGQKMLEDLGGAE